MVVPLDPTLASGAAVLAFPPKALCLTLFCFSPFSSLFTPFSPVDGIPLGSPALAAHFTCSPSSLNYDLHTSYPQRHSSFIPQMHPETLLWAGAVSGTGDMIYIALTPSVISLTLCELLDCSPQPPLSMGFFRQEYWRGLPFPTPGSFPNPGIGPTSPVSSALVDRCFYH